MRYELNDYEWSVIWIRAFVDQQSAWANIPPKMNRKDPICFNPHLYRARNLVERFFNKIEQCRRVATRYDKLAAITSPSSCLLRSAFGYGLMSPRPRSIHAILVT